MKLKYTFLYVFSNSVLITVVDLLIEREQGNKKKAQLVITDDVVHYIVVSQATIIRCSGR